VNHIDLFSGIGGFALAAQWAGFKTVAFVEIDEYAQEIIKQNFGAVAYAGLYGQREREELTNGQQPCRRRQARSKFETFGLPRIYSDIRDFDGTRYRGAALLTGGFPCQPFSQAGKRRGTEDDRYLWPEMLRVISQARPAWVVGENVAGIIGMELDRVLSDLEGEGYAVQPLVIPACAVDAKHRRDRVWIVAHRNGNDESTLSVNAGEICEADHVANTADTERRPGEHSRGSLEQGHNGAGQASSELRKPSEDVADAAELRLQGAKQCRSNGKGFTDNQQPFPSNYSRWQPEPDVGRVAHGIPARVDRLKGLGNAIVPQVAYEILKGIADQMK
jgi:DNA (cytosine-5)-methyltransferase 1